MFGRDVNVYNSKPFLVRWDFPHGGKGEVYAELTVEGVGTNLNIKI